MTNTKTRVFNNGFRAWCRVGCAWIVAAAAIVGLGRSSVGDVLADMGGGGAGIPVINAANGVTLGVVQIQKTMHDGQNIPFWVYCQQGSNNCRLPGPVLELGVGQTANVTLNVMMAPQEQPPYNGHTIHPHGLDVSQSEDGVPETGAAVLGDTYNFSVDSRYVGSFMYHCHVHTVKHLEMGMYGAFVVKAVDSRGNFLNVINANGPAFDYEWTMVLSAVDPTYHAMNAVGDSTVFADYNPAYFLLNGNEGLSTSAPSEVFAAAVGKKLAIHLIGVHSIGAAFQIRDASGNAQPFVLYNRDGFALPSPQTVTGLDIAPGQTADVMVTLPSRSGAWYPQVTYKSLRDRSSYTSGTVYAKLTF